MDRGMSYAVEDRVKSETKEKMKKGLLCYTKNGINILARNLPHQLPVVNVNISSALISYYY